MALSRVASRPPILHKLLSDDLRWQIVKTLTHSDYRVGELTRRLKKPTNLVSYHLKRLSAAQVVRERRSSARRPRCLLQSRLEPLAGDVSDEWAEPSPCPERARAH